MPSDVVLLSTPATEGIPERHQMRVAVGPERTRDIAYYYVTRDAEVPHFLAWAKGLRVLGYDLETSGLDALIEKIGTMQLGNPLGEDPRAYVFDVRCLSREALEPVLALLADPVVIKLGQNLKFEYKFTKTNFGVGMRGCHDTQVTELVVRCGLFAAKAARLQKGGGERAGYTYTSMAALTQRYLGLDIDKDHDLRTSFYTTEPGKHNLRQIVYAASDVVYPFYIAEAQRVEVEARKLRSVLKVEYGMIPVLGEAELRGIRMDTKAWNKLWQRAVKERARVEAELDKLLLPTRAQQDMFDTAQVQARPIYPKKNTELNYDAPEQVKWAIQAYCKAIDWPVKLVTTLPAWIKLKEEFGAGWMAQQEERGRTVEARDVPDRLVPEDRFFLLHKADGDTLTLGMCRKQLPAELVQLLLEYAHWSIRVSSFGSDFVRKHVRADTGRLHTEIHQAITNTGRLSTAPNTQNCPKEHEYRSCFIPAANYKFVICDYASQEPRLTAQMSNDPTYVACFLGSKPDLYLDIAELALGERPDKKTPEGARQRQNFKITGLSKAYRAGVAKLRDQLTIWNADAILNGTYALPTWDDAYDLDRKFVEATPGLLEFQNHFSSTCDPSNDDAPKIWDTFLGDYVTYATSVCGRKRFFPPEATSTYTEGPNFPIQGGSATMTKAAAVLILQEIDRRGWQDKAFIVNLVHDEIVAEVHESIAEEYAVMQKAMMEQAGNYYCPDIPIVAEYPENSNGVVPYWTKEMKE